jgi:hypothetical protein
MQTVSQIENLCDFTQVTNSGDEPSENHRWSYGKRLAWFFGQKNNKIRSAKIIWDRVAQACQSNPRMRMRHYGFVNKPFLKAEDYKDPSNQLHFVEVGDFSNGRPVIVLIAGVHGYEPSGVAALVQTLKEGELEPYLKDFNFAVFPLVSPWAFEHDHRYNAFAEDVNRTNPLQDEMHFLLETLKRIQKQAPILMALDFHETPHERDKVLRLTRASMEGTKRPSDEALNKFVNGFHMMVTDSDDAHTKQKRRDIGREIFDALEGLTDIASNETIAGYPNDNGLVFGSVKGATGRNALSALAWHVFVTEVVPNILNPYGAVADPQGHMGLQDAADIQKQVMRTAIEQTKARLIH